MEVIKSVNERIASFSPRYQAPELMRGSSTTTTVESPSAEFETSLTAAGDVYSLSMTFYHLIAHVEPFNATTHPTLTSPASIIRAVLDGERPAAPSPAEHSRSEVGGNLYDEDLEELWSILRQMWDQDPSKRPSMERAATKIMELQNRGACHTCLELHRVGTHIGLCTRDGREADEVHSRVPNACALLTMGSVPNARDWVWIVTTWYVFASHSH